MNAEKKKVVVITGSSSGIGADLMDVYHEKGYVVVGLARRTERLKDQCTRFNQNRNQSAFFYTCDVSNEENVKTVFTQILKDCGQIDGVIANAGIGIAGTVRSLAISDYRKQFETNVFGVLSCFYASSEQLIQNKGFFAVVGSVNSYLALPSTSAYCMSKFSVRAFTEALFWEMKKYQVSVTLICPGFIETEIRKVGNDGVFREKAKDPIPAWLMMKSRKAAEISYQSILKKKKEVIITGHGKLAVFLTRHIPFTLNSLFKSLASGREDARWNRSES